MASLDDMLGSGPEDTGLNDAPADDAEGSAAEENGEDEFSMHAEAFLDDTAPMQDRIEALRAAILAASAPPDDLGGGPDLGSMS